MRLTRILLPLVLAGAIAGVVVPSAGALAFEDTVCPFATGTLIKICPSGSTGKSYSMQIKGREGTGCVPYVYFKAVGTLPPGLTLSSSGLVSGTPTQSGDWTFWIEMHDIPASEGGISWCADNKSTEEQFRISIGAGLQILQRQATLGVAQVNTAYSMQFSTNAASASWSVSSGSLPAGLTLNSSTGLLTGSPTAAGDYTFAITAADSGRSDSQTYRLSVVPKLQATSAAGVGEVGIAFQLAPQATGGRGQYTWSLGAGSVLPAGLTMDPATGAISGKPTAAGNAGVNLVVTDSIGLTSTVNVPLNLAPQLLIIRKLLATAKVGKKYSAFLRASGGVVPRTWIMLGGRPGLLPPGMKLNARTGQLSGTPRKAGTYRLRLQVTDKLGAHSAAGFVLKVKA
jgi:large repetitive protein